MNIIDEKIYLYGGRSKDISDEVTIYDINRKTFSDVN